MNRNIGSTRINSHVIGTFSEEYNQLRGMAHLRRSFRNNKRLHMRSLVSRRAQLHHDYLTRLANFAGLLEDQRNREPESRNGLISVCTSYANEISAQRFGVLVLEEISCRGTTGNRTGTRAPGAAGSRRRARQAGGINVAAIFGTGPMTRRYHHRD